jgi:ParB family transcriptional regulator, chromosome partitioning protein
MQRRSLGRGLSDLLSGANAVSIRAVIEVAIDRLQPNPYQPRHTVDPDQLAELADSLRAQGILQPLLVREIAGGYQIIAGERRWRAAKLLDLPTVPCIVHQLDDSQALQVALIENLQRDDLNSVDQARAFRCLIEEFGMTQEEVATRVGKSRSTIANSLRLLSLPVELQDAIAGGTLTEGHARALLGLREEPALLYAAYQRIADEGLNVRQTEELVRRLPEQVAAQAPPCDVAPGEPPLDVHAAAAAERLQQALAARVTIKPRRRGGTIKIIYHDLEELNRLLDTIAPELDF